MKQMQEKQITQYQLAEQAGYTQAYISQICSGKRIPTIGALTRIGQSLGVPVQVFLQDGPPATPRYPPLSEQEERITLLYRMLNESNQAMLTSIAEQMYTAQSINLRTRGGKEQAK